MPDSLYRYIWNVNPRGQILLIVLTVLVFPLSMVPLELQRRIVNDAIKGADVDLLLLLGGGYLAYMVVHGGLKFLMNMQLARIIQQATLHLREAVYYCIYSVVPARRAGAEPARRDREAGEPPHRASDVARHSTFVRHQHSWDISGFLRKGGFLAHRNSLGSEDETEIRAILQQRERIKRQTIEHRRLLHSRAAA